MYPIVFYSCSLCLQSSRPAPIQACSHPGLCPSRPAAIQACASRPAVIQACTHPGLQLSRPAECGSGRVSPCDELLLPHLADQQHVSGYSGLRNITISTQGDRSPMSSADWGVIMFQDRIESITLRACIPTNFPFLLSHLLVTRSSLRQIDLTGCWNDYNSLQLLVSTFLFATTDHSQMLVIRDLPPGTQKTGKTILVCCKSLQACSYPGL